MKLQQKSHIDFSEVITVVIETLAGVSLPHCSTEVARGVGSSG